MLEALREADFFGAGARFHHVGLAVDSIEGSPKIVNEHEGVAMAFVRLNGVTVELLEPLGESSPIVRNLRAGTKLLHLCYEVPDLAEAVALSRPAGFHRLGPPKPSPAFDGRRVAWVYSKEYGLFELLEMR